MNNTKQNIQKILASGLELETQRDLLWDGSHTDAFPGGLKWLEAAEYKKAYEAFTLAHPELVAADKVAKTERAEKDTAEVSRLGWI